jgi:pimeloyl-ACP methyl ester carboxylesterase
MKTPSFIALLVLSFIAGCSQWKFAKYRRSDGAYSIMLSYPRRPWQISHVNLGPFSMRFISVGDTTLPTLVLVHGSPGSITTFEPLLSDTGITNHIRLIAMDRPGYGYSNFGKADTSVLSQAKLIHKALHQQFALKKYSLLGYSYGGPVAAVMAAMDTGRVKKLMLVSASVAPGKEKTYKISKAIKNPTVGIIFPKVIKTANTEKLTHLSALNEVRFLYQKIGCKVVILHGSKDKLIYPGNAMYMQQSLISADSVSLATQKGGHRAIIWKDEIGLKQIILQQFSKK